MALTGYGRDEDRARSREAGFDHHFTKPVELDMLLSLIESHARAGVGAPIAMGATSSDTSP